LRSAIWTLLDLKTITEMGPLREAASGQAGPGSLTAPETEQTFPGRNGRTDADVVVDLVQRHLADIKAAYPLAFNHSGLAAPGAIAGTLNAALRARMPLGTVDPLGADVYTALSTLTIQPAPPAHPPAQGTYGGGTTKLAVQLEFAGDQTIGDIAVAGRGDTIHGSQQFSHLTAHIAVVRAVAKTVQGGTVFDGLNAMRGLADRLTSLPTYPDRAAWGWQESDGTRFDPRQVLSTALDTLDEAVLAAESATDPIEAGEALQQLVASYLAARNALPLTSVHIGGLADGSGEGTTRADLDRIGESPGIDTTPTGPQRLHPTLA